MAQRGESRKFLNYKKFLPTESPFEILEWPLRRDFPREAGAAKADAKLGSSAKERPWGLAGGVETSNLRGNVTGLRQIFLFRLLKEERILLGPGGPRTGAATGR